MTVLSAVCAAATAAAVFAASGAHAKRSVGV